MTEPQKNKERKSIAKWGFGMAPISSRMQRRYDAAVQTTLDLFGGNIEPRKAPLDDISELKGMFNRCLRQDQWDWFSVFTEFGEPTHKHLREIVHNLQTLRRSITTDDQESIESAKQRLIDNNLLLYLHNYLEVGMKPPSNTPTRKRPTLIHRKSDR